MTFMLINVFVRTRLVASLLVLLALTLGLGGLCYHRLGETGSAAAQVLAAASALSRQSEHMTVEVARFLDTVRAA
ncbi:hypothetical protein VQ03_09050 [Methylobacterium tarhaniae]|uniref:Chemotaxis protein n=2 Tax=Methylobacterium tarhaniae TaxID=1187852 RepID=A0A0J6TBJ1_9HYPH|nr:hypothetical protein VQ03_09050 [Methylobacterium tarhaniae]